MLETYQTLAWMRYLDPSWIQPGPHDLSPSLLALYSSLNIDSKIIYLYSVLPYIDPAVASNLDFFQGSAFADFRNEDHVTQARNPMYAEEESEKMRLWMTPLSMLGNHQSVIIYDAKDHLVGIYDQESMESSDRNIEEGKIFMVAREDGTERYFRVLEDKTEEECGVEEWERQVRGGEGESEGDEEDGEEDEEDNNSSDEQIEGDEENDDEDDQEEEDENQWDEMQARPAPNVLRDIARWYRELVDVPGGGEHSGWQWQEEITRPLYLKHGWPGDDFDGDAFLVDQARAYVMDCAKDEFAKLAEKLRTVEYHVANHEREEPKAREEHQKRLAAAKNVDEEWVVYWEQWQRERRFRSLNAQVEAAKQAVASG